MGQYLPVLFELDDFQLALHTAAAAKFNARMKELGFTVQESKGLMIWQRHDSRLCAQLNKDMSISFLPDFYDKTPGGTIYAILEKLAITFGGTMVGRYKVNHPQVNHQWSIRISGGMNLTGDDTVGQRDQVSDVTETALGASPSSSSQTLASGRQSYSIDEEENSSGNIQGELKRPASARDKAYKLFVEERYAKWVQEENGGNHDLDKFAEFVRDFNIQFPQEEKVETEEEKTWKKIRAAIASFSCRNDDDASIKVELDGLDSDDMEELCIQVTDEVNNSYGMALTDGEVHDYIQWKLYGGMIPTATAQMQTVQGHLLPSNGVAGNTAPASPNFNASHAASYQNMANASVQAPAGWAVPEQDMEECIRWIGAKLYYATQANNTGVIQDVEDELDVMRTLITTLHSYRTGAIDVHDVYTTLHHENLDPVNLHAGLKQIVPGLKPAVTTP